MAGCNFAATPRESTSSGATPDAIQEQAQASKTSKAAKATEQNWNRALEEWWGAWQKSTTVRPVRQATPSSLPLVTIDLSALVARHPAWKLANALEANRASTLDFAAVRAAEISVASLRAPSFDVNLEHDAPTEATPALPVDADSTVEGYQHAAETVIAHGIEALQSQARDQQSDTIEIFLRAVAANQADAREHYTQIRRASIESDVEVARSTPLPELEAPSMSPEEQLLVTNLRLQLLRNIYSTEAERDRAREQLNEILSRWQARLQQQEIERIAQLERRRVDLPREAREAGEAELREDLDRVRREQRGALRLVWQEHAQRVRQDFGNDDTRLGIVLPAATLSAQTLDATSTPDLHTAPKFQTVSETSNFLETNFAPMSSQPAFLRALPGVVTTTSGSDRVILRSGERSTLIRTLRSQAWSEARKQAQWAARRFGWRWQPAAAGSGVETDGAPDRTREVLLWLAN